MEFVSRNFWNKNVPMPMILKNEFRKRPVPQTMIDDGGSPSDCETVKNYYTALAGLVRIGKVYVL